MKLELIAKNEKGQTYQADNFKVLYRNAGSISGDNNINVEEHMYLVGGTVAVTVEDTTNHYSAPANFIIPAKTYHKLEAITDIILVMVEVK